MCPFGGRCWRGGFCSVFDCASGNVSCCSRHGNPDGLHLSRVVKSHVSLIQILALVKKGVDVVV